MVVSFIFGETIVRIVGKNQVNIVVSITVAKDLFAIKDISHGIIEPVGIFVCRTELGHDDAEHLIGIVLITRNDNIRLVMVVRSYQKDLNLSHDIVINMDIVAVAMVNRNVVKEVPISILVDIRHSIVNL